MGNGEQSFKKARILKPEEAKIGRDRESGRKRAAESGKVFYLRFEKKNVEKIRS